MDSGKDPKRVAAGRVAARARWGEQPRVVRLDELDSEQRAVVLAWIDATRAANAARAAMAEKAVDDAA